MSGEKRDGVANWDGIRPKDLPGYPWLPCPICGYTGGCDHTRWERARAALPGLHLPKSNQK